MVTINLSDIETINNARYREDYSSQTYKSYKDYDYTKCQAKKFSGVKVVQETEVEKNQKLIIEIESELKSGNLEIIVLGPSNNIIENVQVNSTRQVVINNTMEGIYKVVIGGESANYKIEINRGITN